MATQSEAELIYTRSRGLAEIIRLTLTVTDTPFHEVHFTTHEDYLKLVPELLFEQLPLLRIDGMNLVQSGTIVRHLGRKNKLYGANLTENTRVDMLFDGTRDFIRGFHGFGFQPEDKVKQTMVEVFFPRYLRIFDQILSESESGYLVGSSLTIADLGLLEALLATVDYFTEDAFKEYSHIQAFYQKMISHEKVVKYQKEVRRPKNDESMVAEIRAVMSHMNL